MLHVDAWTQRIKIIAVFLMVFLTVELPAQYRVGQVVVDLGWVDLNFVVECPKSMSTQLT